MLKSSVWGADSGPPPQVASWGKCGPRFSAAPAPRCSCGPRLGVRTSLHRGPMAEAFNEPRGVVAVDKVRDDPLRLRQALEPVEIDALLLERPHEALDDTVALGLTDVGRRDRDPEPLHLVDPSVGDILRPPVAADLESAGDL